MPPRHQAGVETYTSRLAAALAARHATAVFAADDDPARTPGSVSERDGGGYPVIEVAEPRRTDRPSDTWRSPRAEAAFEATLRRFRPDVVHFQNLRFLGFELPSLARRAGARTLATLHDHWLICARDGQLVDASGALCAGPAPAKCAACLTGYRWGLSPAEARAARVAARFKARFGPDLTPTLRRGALWLRRLRAGGARPSPDTLPAVEARSAALLRVFDAIDLFTAPSAFVATVHVAAGLPPARIVRLPYGMDPPRRTSPISRPGSPLRIGYFGTVTPHKGPDLLIDAFSALPPGAATLDVHGRDDQRPEFSGPLKRRGRALGVRFHGAYRPEEAGDLLAGVDVVVAPSRWQENFPLAVLEARAAGRAAVVAETGGLREMVRDRVDGLLFRPGDAVDLARALRELLDDREAVARYAAAAPRPATTAEHVATLERLYAGGPSAEEGAP
ncbi:MAG TPA: glycosyltransferase, partial [Planctomycetota bacterium]|nr:glycosyltransferase [Planctomycetota bacterium]